MSCEKCPTGYFAEKKSSPSCKSCAPAKYINETGKDACKACKKGSWTRGKVGSEGCFDCLRGEIFTGARCEVCKPGRYSFLPGEEFFGCHTCPDGAFCPGGNPNRSVSIIETVQILPGYWLSPGSKKDLELAGDCQQFSYDNSPIQCDVLDGTELEDRCDLRTGKFYDQCGVLRQIHECVNPIACTGTSVNQNNSETSKTGCSESRGHMGPLCQTCNTSAGFFMTSSGCDSCEGHLHPGIRICISLFSVLLIVLGSRIIMRTLNKNRKYDNALRHVSELFVVLFDFLQIAGSISSIYSVRMPPYIRSFFAEANIVNFDIVALLGLNCMGADVTFYTAFTFTMMIPFLSVTIVMLGYLSSTRVAKLKLKSLKKKKMGWARLIRLMSLVVQRQADRRARFYTIGVHILSLLYMPIAVRCFRFFQCMQIDDKTYLMADMREECFTDKWYGFIGVAILVIIFFCIGFPLLIFKTLFNIRHSLDELATENKFGFLYNQ